MTPYAYTYEKMGFTTNAFILTASDALTLLLFVFAGICFIQIYQISHDKKFSKVGIVMQDVFPIFVTKLAFASHMNLTDLKMEES